MAQSRPSNLFELLRDESSEGKKRKEEKKTDAKAAAPKAAPKKAEPTQKADAPKTAPAKAAPKSADVKPKQERQDKPVGDRKPRTENGNRELRPKGEGRPREDRRDKADRNRGDQVREDKGFVHPTKRAFERRSGTGRPYGGENKKGGAGKGNWGKPGSEQEALADVNTELAEQTEENTQKTSETKESEPVVPKQLTPEEEAALKEKEKEERMLTLEEYRKKQKEEKAKIRLPELRKAGEGSNEKKWANYQKLEKEEDSLFSTVQKKKGSAATVTATTTATATATATSSPGTKKSVVPVTDVLHVKQERKSERGGRDARGGGGRGRGQRGGAGGGSSGARGKAEEFSLNDQAFPALSEKVKA